MANHGSTLRDVGPSDEDPQNRPYPGLILLFSQGKPAAQLISLDEGPVELGRGALGMEPDPRMSRRHARVCFDGTRFLVQDLGSQNGTAADGKPAPPEQPVEVQRVIRMGDSLFGVLRNARPFLYDPIKVDGGRVLGPALQSILVEARQATEIDSTLHITGESGVGKELVARAFHENGTQREGRFVPVNCAAIPQGLAERLLFGTRRGAYSGADADADGYIQSAAGGTLFLDEVGDLDLNVQAKLLRVLESHEIVPLGASRPRSIELKICSATNKDLRSAIMAGRFREDLYYRIGRPVVKIPPLRKRMEEIPLLIDTTLRRISTSASTIPHASFVEACLLRPWPGNVRELLVEIRSAAQTAARLGSQRIESRHLAEGAGLLLRHVDSRSDSDVGATPPLPMSTSMPTPKPLDPAERARLEEALRSHNGNVSGAARALGMHRTQLRRLLERHGIDQHRSSGENIDPDEP